MTAPLRRCQAPGCYTLTREPDCPKCGAGIYATAEPVVPAALVERGACVGCGAPIGIRAARCRACYRAHRNAMDVRRRVEGPKETTLGVMACGRCHKSAPRTGRRQKWCRPCAAALTQHHRYQRWLRARAARPRTTTCIDCTTALVNPRRNQHRCGPCSVAHRRDVHNRCRREQHARRSSKRRAS